MVQQEAWSCYGYGHRGFFSRSCGLPDRALQLANQDGYRIRMVCSDHGIHHVAVLDLRGLHNPVETAAQKNPVLLKVEFQVSVLPFIDWGNVFQYDGHDDSTYLSADLCYNQGGERDTGKLYGGHY